MAYFSFFSFVALIASLQSISASVDKPKSNKIISQLGTYSISDVTVSGLSSGGYMAVQFHVAFSSVVNGSAIFAGGPYFCAEANLIYAEDKCMATYMGTPDISTLVKYTSTQAALRTIDDPTNMNDDKIYLFSGKGDTVVDPTVMESLQTYYQLYTDVSNIVADYNILAEHCFPTLSYGEACATLASPYIGRCNYDGAYMALSTLYGDLTAGTAVDDNLIEFSQTPFFSGQQTSLGSAGYIYVPTACASGKTSCHLHVSFHGCKQDLDTIGNVYADKTGLNDWAENNNIIILYPYAEVSNYNPSNPNGCWDWWAYTGIDYALQSGVQMQFVKSMIDHISGTSVKTL